MGLLEWRFGRAALSLCSVVDSVCRASVMSMSCSSVGFILALTSELFSVGWRSGMNRGEMK